MDSVMPHKVHIMGIGPQIACGMPHENALWAGGVCLTGLCILQPRSSLEWVCPMATGAGTSDRPRRGNPFTISSLTADWAIGS